MYGYIYKTTNNFNGKIYVGQRKYTMDYKNPKSIYLGSGLLLRKAIKKYGKENFTKEVLEKCKDIDSLNEKEIYWIEKLESRDHSKGYNITRGGKNGTGVLLNHPNKEDIIRRIAESNRGKKGSCPMLGKFHSDETKKKMSLKKIGISPPNKGVPMSKETRKKMSELKKGSIPWNKGIPMTEEQKKKVSKGRKGGTSWNKGIPMREGTKEKLRISSRGNKNMLGKKHSEETKRIISEKNKGNIAPNRRKVVKINLDGVFIEKFDSLLSIMKSYGEASRYAVKGGRLKNGKISFKYKGYIWRYLDELSKEEIKNKRIIL